MADISKITLPNGDSYDIKDAEARLRGSEFIVGTQTATTGAWTGVSKDTGLYDGKQIVYYLPYAGSGNASLKLTFSGGTTSSAIPVYLSGTTYVTTHYAANSAIRMTYKQDKNAWFVDADRDTNTNVSAYQLYYHRIGYYTSTSLARYVLMFTQSENLLLPMTTANDDQGTSKVLTTESFDPFGRIYMYYSTTVHAAGDTIQASVLVDKFDNVNTRYWANTGTTLTPYKAMYLVCVPQGDGLVKLHTNPISQTLPTTEDGLVYIYLGQTWSNYQMELFSHHPIYIYKNGVVCLYTGEPEDPIRGSEFIMGTQTASTGAWTGVSTDKELYDGKQIIYYLPYAGSGSASLTLTFAGGTVSDPIPVYLYGTTRASTQYAANTTIRMTYIESKSGWFVDGDRDVNDLAWQVRNQYASYYTYTALYRYQVCFTKDERTLLPTNAVNNSTGTTKTLTTESFDPFGPIYYYSSTTTISAGAKISQTTLYQQILVNLRYSFNTGTTLETNRAVYLVCVPQANGLVKLHTSPIAQTLPTTQNGLLYIYLGQTYDNYRVALSIEHPIYEYRNGSIQRYVGQVITSGDIDDIMDTINI